MKYYFKRKNLITNELNKYCLVDAAGNKVYDWKSSILLTKKIRIFDANKNEVAVVKQVLKSLMPKYQIFVNGEMVLEIKKEFHPLLAKYTLNGSGWEMDNQLMLFEYGMKKDGETVLTQREVEEHMFSQCQTYELDVNGYTNEVVAVAAAVAINFGIEGDKMDMRNG